MAELPAEIPSESHGRYRRHRPELTLLYQIVEQHYPEFHDLMRAQGRELPAFVQREFDEYLKCGRLEHGFLRVRCNDCHAEDFVGAASRRDRPAVTFNRNRGETPLPRSMLVDEVLPRHPVRQWVLSVPFALRLLFARDPAVMSSVLGIVIRAISSHLIARAGYTRAQAQTGAVTLIHRARPCARPCGRPLVLQIGSPADLSEIWGCVEPQRPLAVHGGTNAAGAWMRRSGAHDFS